jgi:hypothetical protein
MTMIVMPKTPQPSAADHAFAMAYADLGRAAWVRDVITDNNVMADELTGLRDRYLTHAAACELDAFAWAPQRAACNSLYTTWAVASQESATLVHRFVIGLGCSESQLLMQSFDEERNGYAIAAGDVPPAAR